MDGRIYKLKELLLKRLDHHWTVEEMAGMVNLSLPHLHKLFRAETGMPPMNFLKRSALGKGQRTAFGYELFSSNQANRVQNRTF